MNHKLIEKEFIQDNSHCSLSVADMESKCAYVFRIWMGCTVAHTYYPYKTILRPYPQCKRALNNYMYVFTIMHVYKILCCYPAVLHI